MKSCYKLILILSAGALLLTPAYAEQATISGAITPFLESHYISEGRDNLDGTGLFSTQIEASSPLAGGNLSLGVWYASAYDTEYDEMNTGAGYEIPLGRDITATLGYTYLNVRTEDADDHEVSLDVAYTGVDGWTLFADAYYSVDAEGVFSEIGLQADLPVPDGVVVSPFALLGINQDYVGEGHDGANHAVVGIEVSIALTPTLSLDAYGAYTLAIDKDADRYPDDASLEDLVYGGIGLTAGF